jgi:hypothetical protein
METKFIVVGVVVAVVTAVASYLIFLRRGGSDDWAAEDKFAPPPFPAPAVDASPQLVSAKPLDSTHRYVKPVVAADHQGNVVVIAEEHFAGHQIAQWTSYDGGGTWEGLRYLPHSPDDRVSGDPWLATDRRGRFYCLFICITAPKGLNAFHRSCNGGKTWSPRISVTPAGDRPLFGVSPDGKLLVTASSVVERTKELLNERLDENDPNLEEKIGATSRWYSAMSVSEDWGAHWRQFPGPLKDLHAIPFSVVVGDDGKIASSHLAISKGETESVVCTALDHGRNWNETTLEMNLQPDRPHAFNGARFPVLAADGDKNLHVAFINRLAKGLFVRKSKDWINWDSPVQLSSVEAEEVRMPAIAAWGPMVHVTWMERRSASWQMYYCGSKNNGRTWSDRLLLSVPDANCSLINGDGFQITCDDDQTSVTDDGLGNAHIVWAVSKVGSNAPGTVWHGVVRWQRPAD